MPEHPHHTYVLSFRQVLGVEMFRRTAGAEADEHMASLMGHFGQTTNSLSLLMSLFGTSLCVRLLGLRRTLRIFPTLLVVAVVTSFFAPSLSFLFVAVAILKVRVWGPICFLGTLLGEVWCVLSGSVFFSSFC